MDFCKVEKRSGISKKVFLLSAALLVSLSLSVFAEETLESRYPETATEFFSDVSDVGWAHDAIFDLATNGIITGNGDGTFAPNNHIKREEFVQMLDKVFGYSKAAFRSKFIDVNREAWYYPAISGASYAKVVTGYEDNTFGVGKNITREDAAVILMRAVGERLSTENINVSYTDEKSISEYAKSAVETLTQAGVLNGKDNNCFAPKSNLTRAEAAQMFYGVLQKIN